MSKKIKLDTTFHINDDLKKTLEDMKKYCPVAKKLLSIKSTDELSRYVNYLGISQDNNSFISYLDDKRAITCIQKFKRPKTLQEIQVGDTVRLTPRSVREIKDYYYCRDLEEPKLTCRNTVKVLAIEGGEIRVVYGKCERWFWDWGFKPVGKTTDFYVSSIRYHTSCVKLVKRLFDTEFTEQQYSNFCSMFKVYHPSTNYLDRFTKEFVKGDNILDWYNGERYASEGGTLGNSCMRYEKCREWLQIYADNPETIQLFIVKNEDGKLAGRCLIWGEKYFDRIYGMNNDVEIAMLSHLRVAGFIDIYNDYDGDTVTFKLNKSYRDYDYFPYMDTFACMSGKEIWNSTYSDEADRVLRSADGRWDGWEEEDDDDEVRCEVDDNYYPSRDCHYFDHLSGWVHADNTTWCECINQSWPDNDVTRLYNGDYAPDDQITELFNGTYAHQNDDDLAYDIDGDYFIYGKHDYVEVNDEWYPEDDDRICYTNNSKYMLKEECVEIDGEWYDKDDCFFSETHGWTLEEVIEDDVEQIENPLQLKLFECELTENCS